MFIKILSKKITKSILFVFFVFFVVVIKINAENLPVRVDPEDNPTNFVNKTTYTLLAPFGDSLTTIDTTNVADYFNLMIKIFIGLCAVLAVVMIVVFGIQYMGTDSIFSKSEAKKRIGGAILGLLIALGSYAFLNTINPALLDVNLNIGRLAFEVAEQEQIKEVGAGAIVNGTNVTIKPGFATICKGGVVDIPSDIPHSTSQRICRDLIPKLKELVRIMGTSGWTITSAIRGKGTQSSCHLSGTPTSGNCVDIAIYNGKRPSWTRERGSTNPNWGKLCVAVASVGGLNFANEATSLNPCQSIKPYRTYTFTSGPHLHVNLIN